MAYNIPNYRIDEWNIYKRSLPLLNIYVLRLGALHQRAQIPESLRSVRLSKRQVILDSIPTGEKNKFLILTLFVNAPSTTVRVRSRVSS